MLASIFRGVSGMVLLLMALVPATADGQEIKVTLLGTGTPPPVMNRFGPSILVEAGGQKFLFDAGRGALQRPAQNPVAGCGWGLPHASSLGSRRRLSGSVVDGVAREPWARSSAPRLGPEGNEEDDVAP